MKIAVIGSYTPSLVNFRGPLLKELVAAGHEVWGMGPEEDPASIEKLSQMGVQFKSFPLAVTSLNPVKDLKSAKALSEVLAEIQADAILCYTLKVAIWGIVAAHWARVPRRTAMITGFGTAFLTKGAKGALMKKAAVMLLRWSMKKATAVVVQNEDDLKELQDIGIKSPMHQVNGSGVDLSHYDQKPLPPYPTKFLMISRLLKEKGVIEFARAAEIVRRERPEVTFSLVGWHEERSNAITREEINRWSEKDILTWHGAAADVRPHLEACHVLVLPSYREGTPRSVLEALATGRAVITTDTNGCRSTIEQGVQGFLVPVQDSEALAEAMIRLVDNPAQLEAMAAKARQRAADKYDVNKVNREMMRIIAG